MDFYQITQNLLRKLTGTNDTQTRANSTTLKYCLHGKQIVINYAYGSSCSFFQVKFPNHETYNIMLPQGGPCRCIKYASSGNKSYVSLTIEIWFKEVEFAMDHLN